MNRADRRRAKAHLRKLSDRAVAALAFHAVRGEDPYFQIDFVIEHMERLGRPVPPDVVALATGRTMDPEDARKMNMAEFLLPFSPRCLQVAGIADVWP